MKNFGEKGAWVYPGTAQIFGQYLDTPTLHDTPVPIISGTGKATNFQFCTHFLSIDRNKRPLQSSGKVVVDSGLSVVRTLEIFAGPYIGHRAVVFAIAQLSCFNVASRQVMWQVIF